MRAVYLFFLLTIVWDVMPAAAQQTCSMRIGDAAVHLVIHRQEPNLVHFLNLHDDENTSVAAALAVMEEKGGRLVELKHGGTRLITFRAGGREYQFDPNRMFTPEGRKATLKRYSVPAAAAEKELGVFADSVLNMYGIDTVPCIVTLHNNTENNFSAKSYLPGAIYDKEARKVHIEPGVDADDFIVVTRGKFYRFYKRRGINVVLQSKRPTDDGSLSVYAERHRIPYINIEAQEDHLEQQKRMIALTYRLLESPPGGFSSLFGKLFR